MSENAKQNTLGPYFHYKMDEIDDIGHSDVNSSLLHQSCMVKSYFDAYFVCSHFGSLKCIIMHRTKDIDQLLPSYVQILGHHITEFSSCLARIDHDRTTPALYGQKSNKLQILVTHFT